MQDLVVGTTVYFYPAIRIDVLNSYTFWPYQQEISVTLIGKNFINTAKELVCRIANVDNPKHYLYATYIIYGGSS